MPASEWWEFVAEKSAEAGSLAQRGDVVGARNALSRALHSAQDAPFHDLANPQGMMTAHDDPGESVAGAIEKARQNSFFEKLGELFTLF